MKKFYLLFLILLISKNVALTQQTWYQQTSGTTEQLNNVYFVDAMNGWIAGNFGTILRTTNAGEQWIKQSSGTSNNLNDIYFSDINNGIAVGDSGTLISTKDGGVSWTNLNTGTQAKLNCVSFSDPNNGWAAGAASTLLITTDAGKNWKKQSTGINIYFKSLSYTSKLIASAVGSNNLFYRTTDGGESWLTNSLGTYPWDSWSAVFFLDDNNGFILRQNYIASTTNGGNSWKRLSTAAVGNFSKCYFYDSNNGLVVAPNGVIYRTSNGGATWDAQQSNTQNNLLGVYMTTPENCTIVGANGTILRTSDFGTRNNAPVLTFPKDNSINNDVSVVFLWSDISQKASSFQFQLSSDSSFINFLFNQDTIRNSNIKLNGMKANTYYYWRVRAKVNNIFGSWSEKRKFKTLDKIPYLVYPLDKKTKLPLKISFQWEKAADAKEYKLEISTDSLFIQNLKIFEGITEQIKEVVLEAGTKYFWRVGAKNNNGLIYWSAGRSFSTGIDHYKPIFPLQIGNKWFYKVSSLYKGTNQDHYYGIIKEVTDTLNNGFRKILSKFLYWDSISVKTEYWNYINGKFYTEQILDDQYIVYNDYLTKDSCLISPNICWHLTKYRIFNIYGNAQEYTRTFDLHGSGSINEKIVLPGVGIVYTYDRINSDTFMKTDSANLTGMIKNGEVFGDTSVAVTSITSQRPTLPVEYKLLQNYPNPFNPYTIINYQIPQSGHISLKVYDILGNEIASLVNEEKPVGVYNVKFDGSKLSSGVYFYKLQSGEFAEVKKLILIK